MRCDFVVGQKVVMVAAFPQSEIERARIDGVELPSVGNIYTIRGMEPGVWDRNKIFLWLEEVRNKPHHNGLEPNWLSTLFQPVQERETDISIFKAMLTPAGRIPVDA